MRVLKAGILAVVLGLSSQASAYWAPSYYRCAFDQMASQSQAHGRQSWAQTKAQQNNYGYSSPSGKDTRFWHPMYSQDAQDAYATYGIFVYPVYTDPNNGYNPWKGPGAYGTATANYTEAQILALPYTFKPSAVFHDGLCEPGCYTPDQRVLFEEGFVEIEKAQSTGRTDLVTLSPEATFDALKMVPNPVERYTLDREPVKQEILTFRMKSGGSLAVTTEHPLVTQEGTIKKAKNFIAGEELVRQDGSLDEIVIIDREEQLVRTFNVRPVSKDATSNILVAEGYLNGSGRYQTEFVEEYNRVILRRNVPDELIPSM